MDFTSDVDHCLQILQHGGVILYPTDTVWGLGCDATNADAVQKIFAIKQRSETKALIVLLADERELIKYVAHPNPGIFDYLEQTPKPTTVIYNGAIGLAHNVIAEDGSVAIRLVKDDFCRHLIKRFRKPIVSTSANISDQNAPPFFSDIAPEIIEAADYTVHYRREDETVHQPSAIIQWQSDGSVKVLRE